MRLKKYLKNLWNDLRYDESGQWGAPPSGQETLWRKIYKSQTPSGQYIFPQPSTPTGSLTTVNIPYIAPKQPVKPTYTPFTYTGAIGQKQPEKTTYTPPPPQQEQPGTPVTSQIPALSAALGYSYQPYNMPAYNVPQYNVNLPTINWGFEQTPAQQAQQQTQAEATAAQEINPQLQAIAAALAQYKTQGQVQRAELNPRYTNQSLAIANIIQNTVKQEAIDQAIRRGAETSGWLPSALMEAGQLETEQRGQVEAQRSQELGALAALEAQQTQAAGAQETMLEGLRGKRITSALAELENQAWARSQQEKESQWQSALAGEQLRASAHGSYAQGMLGAYQTQAGIGMSNADRALQAAIAATEQGNVQYQQQYTASQDAYQRSLEAAIRTQKEVSGTTDYFTTPEGYKITMQQAINLGYLKPGQYATTGEQSDLDLLRQYGLIE